MMDIFRMAGMNVIFFAIYLVLFLQTLNGNFTIGDMVLLVQLVAMAKQPATMMSWMVDSAQRAAAGSREYFEAMEELEEATVSPVLLAASREYGPSVIPEQDVRDAIPDPPAPLEGCSRPGGTPVVEFENVTFGYDVDDPVIHDVSLTAGFNEKVAPSRRAWRWQVHLVSLLLGLYRLSSGRCASAATTSPRARPAARHGRRGVPDGTVLRHDLENIAYGVRTPDAEIEDAARRANADGFIRAFPQGYDTVIGSAARLSGGRSSVWRWPGDAEGRPDPVLDEPPGVGHRRGARGAGRVEELMVGRTTW